MVGMEPTGPFCDLGAPVIDDKGVLVAIGATRKAEEGEYMSQFIDVDSIKALLLGDD